MEYFLAVRRVRDVAPVPNAVPAGAQVRFRVPGEDPPDTDGDGMPDVWETYFFGSPSNAQAAAETDGDGDGSSNLAEYRAGTDPTDSLSALCIGGGRFDPAHGMVLTWPAVAGRRYTIESLGDPGAGSAVSSLTDIPATPPLNTHTVPVHHSLPVYFRIRGNAE
jgi:hypothetical protein